MSESKSSASYSGNHSASGSDEEVGPNDFDVLLGRGKSNKNNAGNIKFHGTWVDFIADQLTWNFFLDS